MDPFERDLVDGLRRLADGAPEGPHPAMLRRRLRRRAWRRAGVGLAAAAGIVVVTALALRPAPPQESDARLAGGRAAPRSLPSPIPGDAGDETVRDTVLRYFAALGVDAAFVEKRLDEGTTFTLLGGTAVPNEELVEDLDMLLRHFDEASFRLRGDDLEYTLAQLSG